MIALKTYFCPHCGVGYESTECATAGKSFTVWWPKCATCGKSLEVSGWAFIVSGFLLWLFSSMVLDTTTPLEGAILGGILGLFGLVRLIRQEHARRTAQPGAAPDGGPPPPSNRTERTGGPPSLG